MSKLEEGKVVTVDKENSDLTVAEVGKEYSKKAKINDTKSFEEYKTLYKDSIDAKCIEEFGSINDKKLWEDVAKEMYLTLQEYLPTEEEPTEDLAKKEAAPILESKELKTESKEQEVDIKPTGTAGCDYTGGGIWVAFTPVKIDNNNYYITLSSEEEDDELNEGGEFSVCDIDDWNLVPQYGDKGVFIFDKNSKYMSLYKELKSVLEKAVKEDKPVKSGELKTEGTVIDIKKARLDDFRDDEEGIEKALLDIKPLTPEAQTVIDNLFELFNKACVEIEAKTFGVKFEENKEIKEEASLSRLFQHIKDKDSFAIIGSQDQDTKKDRYNELDNEISRVCQKYDNVGYNHLEGTYTYDDGELGKEKSLIIYNIPKEEAIKIAKDLNQESIIWKDKDFFGFIDQNGNEEDSFKNRSFTFDEAIASLYGSKLKSGNKLKPALAFECKLIETDCKGNTFSKQTKSNTLEYPVCKIDLRDNKELCEDYEEDSEDEEDSIFDKAEKYDGNMTTNDLDEYEWKEVCEFAPEVYKQALRARANFVVENFGWSEIPDCLWNYIDGCVDDAIGWNDYNPAILIDNIVVNGDWGDFDSYKEENETDEEFIQRVEDSCIDIYPDERIVVFTI